MTDSSARTGGDAEPVHAPGVVLQPPTFAEFLVVETYKDSYKTSITSLNGSCEKIVTASFSIATAYGALLALVTPKDDVTGVWAALPITALTLAAVFGLIGHARGIRELPTNDFDQVKDEIKGAIDAKKKWAWAAIVTLGCAVTLGGIMTYADYGRSAKSIVTPGVEVTLTADGLATLRAVCPSAVSTIHAAQLAVDDSRAVLTNVTECADADISLPSSQIAATTSS